MQNKGLLYYSSFCLWGIICAAHLSACHSPPKGSLRWMHERKVEKEEGGINIIFARHEQGMRIMLHTGVLFLAWKGVPNWSNTYAPFLLLEIVANERNFALQKTLKKERKKKGEKTKPTPRSWMTPRETEEEAFFLKSSFSGYKQWFISQKSTRPDKRLLLFRRTRMRSARAPK